MVLALPVWAIRDRKGYRHGSASESMGKRHGRAQIEATRNGARPCPFTGDSPAIHSLLLPTAGQKYGNG